MREEYKFSPAQIKDIAEEIGPGKRIGVILFEQGIGGG